MSTDGGEPGKGAGSKASGSKANKQLRELQRLMAWAWDSRVEEHPPGAKAMHDFENVLNFQLDTSRRRRGSATPASAAMDGSDRHARRAGSAERGTKRASPAPAGSGEASKAGRKPGKAARLQTSLTQPAAAATGAEAGSAPDQQQPTAASSLVPQDSSLAATSAAADSAGLAVPSPAAGQGATALEATPAARQQPQQESPPPLPAPCPGAADVTPAVGLGGVAHTPSTLATAQPSRPSTGGAVALADAHFLPTPAPTPLPLGAMLHQPSGEAPAATAAAEPQFRAPPPRSVLTSLKRKAEAAPAAAAAGVAAAPAAAAPAPADSGSAGTAEAALALDLLAAGRADGSPRGPAPGAASGTKCVVPAIFVGSAAAAARGGTASTGSASPMEVDAAEPPVATPAAAPAAVTAEVPTPAARALAAAEQLSFHQPRPAACPPLFKQAPAGSTAKKATAKSPLGSKRRSPASAPAGKENAGLNGSSSSGLTPRTAEPAPPPQAALSAWKQQQLAALSAGFHTRQRRLLELLSACNRVALASPAAGMAAAGAPAQAAPASCGSGSKAAKADGATPALGPRAAAVAAASCWAAAAGSGEGRGARAGMGRALGRLKEQQAA